MWKYRCVSIDVERCFSIDVERYVSSVEMNVHVHLNANVMKTSKGMWLKLKNQDTVLSLTYQVVVLKPKQHLHFFSFLVR